MSQNDLKHDYELSLHATMKHDEANIYQTILSREGGGGKLTDHKLNTLDV
jgi:hypothetical protein